MAKDMCRRAYKSNSTHSGTVVPTTIIGRPRDLMQACLMLGMYMDNISKHALRKDLSLVGIDIMAKPELRRHLVVEH